MPFTMEDMIGNLRQSRSNFLKHIADLRDDQWSWKPYPECKSIDETVAHLIADDRAALQSLQSGNEPEYDSLQEAERDPQTLVALLSQSHWALISHLLETYSSAPLDQEVTIFGSKMKIGTGFGYFSAEDYYHAGQVAFVRMATDPGWDYYTAIYGGHD
jgi:uncharacterized damage-inducible protein DinB